MDSVTYQQILNQNLTASAKKIKLGRDWISQKDSDPKYIMKSPRKWFPHHGTEDLSSAPAPEERTSQSEGSGENLSGGMAFDPLPCVLHLHSHAGRYFMLRFRQNKSFLSIFTSDKGLIPNERSEGFVFLTDCFL